MIPRPFYLQRMIQAQGCDFIKIITGIRRSGKSTLLRMFKDHLLASHVPADHIIEISYEKSTVCLWRTAALSSGMSKNGSRARGLTISSWMKYRSSLPGQKR